MTARPARLDDTALSEVLGSRAAVDDRAQRVRWIGEVATALQRGELPESDAARTFVATALLSWLEHGGSLESDYLRVNRRGSHYTPAKLWQRSIIGDDDGTASGAVPSMLSDEG